MLGIGVSGLLAYQRSLQTVSHNIANANTEGYSRQRVELGTQPPLYLGGNYLGSGVTIQGVERVYDSFLTGQVRTYTSSFNQAEAYADHASLIDEMLADPQVGLMPAVEDFFSSMQGVSNDPSSIPARQALITQGETLVDRFKYLDQRYEDIRSQVNQQLSDNVAEINSLAEAIASINRDIVLAPGQGAPNDLLDARDKLLGQLSEKVSITTLEQDNGAVDVFFGKGQILVLNFDTRALSVTRNEYDVSQFEISLDTGVGGAQEISAQIRGGRLGGLLDFRDNLLTPAQNSLGALAIGMSDTFNAQHRLGQDLNGALGADFFNTSTLQVLPGTGAPSAVVANLVDSKQLTNDEYVLRFDGGNNYTATRSSDNQTFAINTGGASPYTTAIVDGFSLTITAGAAVGDSYLIRPGRTGSSQLDLAINDAKEVAAASPIQTQKTIGNSGSGKISAGNVTNTASLPLGGGGITLQYNSAGNNILITGDTVGGVPAAPYTVPYVNGGAILLNNPGDGTGIEVQISGAPANGDTFTIGNNTNGVGDNRNALLLGQLQTQRLLDNGNASYDEFYSGVVADVGIKTNQAQIAKESQSGLMEQAVSARDALSGVNLDEEAANLVKFQQAYQAASQVIVATNTMFQSLLAAIRG
jgi:flagellar hook-associated protein 1 FlgK